MIYRMCCLRVLGRTVFNEKRTRPGLLLFIFGYESLTILQPGYLSLSAMVQVHFLKLTFYDL